MWKARQAVLQKGLKGTAHAARSARTRVPPVLASAASQPAAIAMHTTMSSSSTSTSTNSTSIHRQLSSQTGRRGQSPFKKRSERDAATFSNRYQTPKERAQAIFRHLLTSVNALQSQVEALPALPPIWKQASDNNSVGNVEARVEIFQRTKQLVQEFEVHVRDGHLHPNGKQRHEVARFLEKVFQLYSESLVSPSTSASAKDQSVLDECQRLIHRMETDWKMELTDLHCESAVLIAAREGRWKEASELYWAHIDPGDSGYIPCDVSVANPIGLYAIARAAQEKGVPVVENVLDGVLRLSMVSPSDQENYILAAGRAIGYAGQWEPFVEYLKTSYAASQLGQPLVAAVMEACLICEQYDEAMDVYDELAGGQILADEWQWGGGQDRLHPLCRDLALRALGRSGRPNSSEQAMQLFHDIQESDASFVTVEALQGVTSAFENEGKWEEAVQFLFFMLSELDAMELGLMKSDNVYSSANTEAALLSSASTDRLSGLDLLLPSVMRACNSEGQFGVALACQNILSGSITGGIVLHKDSEQHSREPVVVGCFAPFSLESACTDDLLAATMVSLSGVGCFQHAARLFEAVDASHDQEMSQGLRTLHDWVLKESAKHEQDSSNHSWDSILLQIQSISSACSAVKSSHRPLSSNDSQLLSTAIASCIRSAISLSHPEMGIYLGNWSETLLLDVNAENPCIYKNGFSALELTDSYLAAAIAAYTATGKLDSALDLVETHYIHLFSNDSSNWILSSSETVRLLFVSGRAKEAMSLFREAIAARRNPDIFCAAAEGLAANGEWQGIADLYRLALTSGCLSEDLSFLAMKSVASGRREGNIRVIRNIVDEIAGHVGMSPKSWIESKYWSLKRDLGSRVARSLMWWEDANTVHLYELELAIEVFESRISSGLRPKFDSVRAIVSAAQGYEEDFVPSYRADLIRVPRKVSDFIRLVSSAVREVEGTALENNPDFVTNVAVAYYRLGCANECVDYVRSALERGVHVRKVALNTAIKASREEDRELPVVDLQTLAID